MQRRTIIYIVILILVVAGFSAPYLAPSFNKTCSKSDTYFDEFDYVGVQMVRNTSAYVLDNGVITAKQSICIEVSNGQNQKAANAFGESSNPSNSDSYAMTFFFVTAPLHVKVYIIP